MNALSQDNAPAGMTPLEWCQAQSKDQTIHQIIDGIQNKMLRKIKIKVDMPSELKALIRLKRQLVLKHGVLYRRTTQVDTKTQFQLVLPPAHCNKAIEGCHDQVGHLGQERVLELLRDCFYWPGMYTDVAFYIYNCPRCLRRKSQPDQGAVFNI